MLVILPYRMGNGFHIRPLVNKRDLVDGKDGELTAEAEPIKAFKDEQPEMSVGRVTGWV